MSTFRALAVPTPPHTLGLVSTPSTCSLQSELAGLSPRSTESGLSSRLFVRASQLSSGSLSSTSTVSLRSLTSWLAHTVASMVVTCYDVLMRLVMPSSWYLLDLDKYNSSAEYLMARAEKKTRRYVESAMDRFVEGLTTGQIHVQNKAALDEADFQFARSIFCGKHGKPWLLYAAWRGFVTLLAAAPYCSSFTTVTDGATGAVLAVFVEFRQGTAVHHFITALVDHEASKTYGIYVAKYDQMLSACTQDGVYMLRMGPTTDSLKSSLGGIRLPLFVVSSPVWLHLRRRCSVVAFGIFTTLGVFAFLWLTQWQMDASGVGRLTAGEYALLYTCCMAFVKTLPLFSIGWNKVLSNPKKYLVQTSFYAQGVVFGGVLFVAITAWSRKVKPLCLLDALCLQVNPLCLLDALCLFALVGDCVGRIGCHYYGCCFGRPMYTIRQPEPTDAFNPWAVVYLDRQSSVCRLRPELRLRPLLPTQLMQAVFAAFWQLVVLAVLWRYNTVKVRLWRYNTVKTGLVGCFVLGMYSVGRTVFFLIREDEKFKSNRSYTTAYIALATLAFCALASVYTALFSSATTTFNLSYVPGSRDLWSYTLVAGVTAAVNMLIQGLHHHEGVGRFPDLSALLAPPSVSDLFSPLITLRSSRSRGLSPEPSGQIWSSWQAEAHLKMQ